MRIRIPLIAVLLSVAAATPFAGVAAATGDTVTWGVKPADNDNGAGRPNYVYDVEPGAVVADAMVVNNHDERDLTFRVYAADGFVTESGQLDLRPADEEPVDVGAWVRVATDEVTVRSGESVEIPFTVEVPANATPGDHTGGVVTSLLVEDGGEGITVERRLGSRIHLRVDGELAPRLSVENLDVAYAGTVNPAGQGSATVSYTVVNTGNARLTATQEVTVAGLFGLLETTAAAPELPELLPGSSFDVRLVVDEVTPTLRLNATVTLSPTVAGTEPPTPVEPHVTRASAWAVPWSALAVLAAAVLWVLWRRRRAGARRPSRAPLPTPTPVVERS